MANHGHEFVRLEPNISMVGIEDVRNQHNQPIHQIDLGEVFRRKRRVDAGRGDVIEIVAATDT
jgi:hypothetical protein